jgi:Short C-terminal domain
MKDSSVASGDGDLVQQLNKLGELRDAGLLDDEDFKLAKHKLLGG